MSTQNQIPQSEPQSQPPKKLENVAVEPESKESEAMDIGSYIGGAQIEKIMNSEGPIVKAVVLKADGTSVEIDYDTTPRKHMVKEILGADPTIIGEWHEMQVILVKGRIESLNVPMNSHKLRWPFHAEEVRGDILLYRVNEEATAIDFTLEEYKAYAARASEDADKAATFAKEQEAAASAEESLENDDDDKEAFAMDEAVMRAQVHNMVRRQFAVKFGREPTAEELEAFSEAVLNQFFGATGEEDPDYNPEEDEAEDDDEDDDDAEFDENVDKDASSCDETEDKTEDTSADIDDAAFAAEFASALDGVRALAVADRQKILEKAKAAYEADTGETADEDTLNQAFNLLKVKLLPSGRIEEEEDESKDASEDAAEDTEEAEQQQQSMEEPQEAVPTMEDELGAEDDDVDVEPEIALSEEELRKEIAEAFDAVRARGRMDGQKIAALVSETFYEINGREADSSDIAEVFSRIKAKLAEEAAEELIYDDENSINYQQPASVTKQVDAAVATLPTDKAAVADLSKREELVAYARSMVTRQMANKARAQFVSLAKREPSVEEFEDLLVTLATTRFIDAEFPEDAESDADYNPNELREQLQSEADQIESGEENEETDLVDAYAVLGAYDAALSPAKKSPVAFFSPVRTNKSEKVDYSSVNHKLYQRALTHFRNIHNREPNADEQANLSKFLTTDGLEYTCSDDEQSEKKPAIAFFSPVRSAKTKKVSDYSILNAKLYERALKHFMAIHKREPNAEERANLSKFLTTDGLDYSCTSDEDDSDYDPSKDTTCDVTGDKEACEKFEAEFKSEETEDSVVPVSQATDQ